MLELSLVRILASVEIIVQHLEDNNSHDNSNGEGSPAGAEGGDGGDRQQAFLSEIAWVCGQLGDLLDDLNEL